MSESPASATPPRAPFDLVRVWLESALLGLLGSGYFATHSLPAMWAWLGAVLWMCLNLGALAMLVRAVLRPKALEKPDWRTGGIAMLLALAVLPAILIALLSWAQSHRVAMAVAAGITLPLAVMLFRALSLLLTRRAQPPSQL